MAADVEIGRQETPGLSIPMHAGTADAVAGQETRKTADRQRGLARIVAERQRFLVGPQKQVEAHRVAQFILHIGRWEIRAGVTPRAALDCDDVEAGLCQFIAEDGPGPSQADDHDILAREFARHDYSLTVQSDRPMMLT